VLTRMSVKNGKLVLPDGMSYRLLALRDSETMTPRLLRRIKELVEAGATVVGPRPLKSPSLSDFPKCDAEVHRLAEQLWGEMEVVGQASRLSSGASRPRSTDISEGETPLLTGATPAPLPVPV